MAPLMPESRVRAPSAQQCFNIRINDPNLSGITVTKPVLGKE